MIKVTLDGTRHFFIDSTEVTAADYELFLDAMNGDTGGQPVECAWNASYLPEQPTPIPDHPVTYVDWCDARAFCAWAGKQLCAGIDREIFADQDFENPDLSQWFRACGGPLGHRLPYALDYVPGTCNDTELGGPHFACENGIAGVGSFEGCVGAYPGLYDMTGNVVEWTGNCNGNLGETDKCIYSGGSCYVQSYCDLDGSERRDYAAPAIGFRCCSATTD